MARAALLVLGYVLVTAGLLVALLMQLRAEAVVASKRELSAFAQLTAGHTFEVAAGLEDALKFTEATLSVAAGSDAADEESIRALLRDVASNARGLKDILVLNAQGKVIYQATGRTDVGRDWSDRPLFTQLQQTPALKFSLGAPFKQGAKPTIDQWFIPVARSWRHSNGDFAGVIVGLISTTLAHWNRTQGTLTTESQARLVLDRLEQDLQGAWYRDDGNVWLAATVQAESSASGIWVNGTKPVATSLNHAAANLADARFGLAGVWLRFFTTTQGANPAAGDAAAPVAVSYQLIRRVPSPSSPASGSKSPP